MSPFVFREDTVDAFVWSTLTTELDANGETLARDIVYDNATTRAETFENGVRSWSSIKRNYDEHGGISDQLTVLDSGLTISTEYQYGAISLIVKEDLNQDGGQSDANAWSRIATYFDEDGSITNRSVTYDSGLHTSQHYTNGTLTFSQKYDLDQNGEASDANPWYLIEHWYGMDGVLSDRVEYRDDGIIKVHHYEEGALKSVSLRDGSGLPGEDDGVKDWFTKWTHFDASGEVWIK